MGFPCFLWLHYGRGFKIRVLFFQEFEKKLHFQLFCFIVWQHLNWTCKIKLFSFYQLFQILKGSFKQIISLNELKIYLYKWLNCLGEGSDSV